VKGNGRWEIYFLGCSCLRRSFSKHLRKLSLESSPKNSSPQKSTDDARKGDKRRLAQAGVVADLRKNY
jgi:hypothetical protein